MPILYGAPVPLSFCWARHRVAPRHSESEGLYLQCYMAARHRVEFCKTPRSIIRRLVSHTHCPLLPPLVTDLPKDTGRSSSGEISANDHRPAGRTSGVIGPVLGRVKSCELGWVDLANKSTDSELPRRGPVKGKLVVDRGCFCTLSPHRETQILPDRPSKAASVGATFSWSPLGGASANSCART